MTLNDHFLFWRKRKAKKKADRKIYSVTFADGYNKTMSRLELYNYLASQCNEKNAVIKAIIRK